MKALPAPDRQEKLSVGEVELHVEHFLPRGRPRLALVAIHGFSSHCGLYRHVASAFAAQEIAVTLFDCRGHGRSGGRRGYVRRFDDFTSDLSRVIELAHGQAPGAPLVLMGHSHGAVIALDCVLRGQAAPHRLVLATPWLALAMKVPRLKLAAARVLDHLWPTIQMSNEIRAEDTSRNPEVIANFHADPLVHHLATPRWFVEVRAVQERIRASAAALRTPTLVVVAGQDRVVSNEVTIAFARAAGEAVELTRYEPLFHEIFLEPEVDQVCADIIAWLRRDLKNSSDLTAPAAVPGIL